MSTGEVIGGAALGVALQVIYEEIKRAKDRSRTTRFILERLNATIAGITPLVNLIDKLSEEMQEDSQRKVIEDLKHLPETAVSLVKTYAQLRRRNILKRLRYTRKIKEVEASLRWMINVNVQVNQWADIKELMAKLSETNTKLAEITRQPIFRRLIISYHKVAIKVSSKKQNDLQKKMLKVLVMNLNRRLISAFACIQENAKKTVKSDSTLGDHVC